MTPKPDSRLPWRVEKTPEGTWEVWTRRDYTTGSRNNYAVSLGIQSEEEAQLIAQAPQLQARVQSLTTAKDAALAILEPMRNHCVPSLIAIREAIEVLKRI